MTDARSELDALTVQLEDAAARLRDGQLETRAAAELIDECARLAARAVSELERETAELEAPPGQDPLL
jgi:hypothetical protein